MGQHSHFSHSHSHSHSHNSQSHGHHHQFSDAQNSNRGNNPQKAFLIATSINFVFVIAEIVYAFMANSMSLLADAGHNLGDVMGLALSAGANWLLTKPASQQYSYGYKKTTVLAAAANASLLIMSTGIIAYESSMRLFHPEPVVEKIIMIIAGIGIFINTGTALLFMKNRHHDLNVKSAFIHLAGDAVISLGVVIAGAVVLITHYVFIDALVALVIAVIILLSTWGLVRDSVNLMLDGVPRHIHQEKVYAYLLNLTGVTAVHDLHIWGLSTQEVALTAHLVMPDNQLLDQDFQKLNADLKNQFYINHVTIQIERGDVNHPCEQTKAC